MNMELFRMINNLADKNGILDGIMIFFSEYVPYIFMVSVAIIFILGMAKKNSNYRKAAVSAFVITIFNLILSFVIGTIYYVDRPFVHNNVNLLFPHVQDASFPSDHATGTMSIALGLEKYNKMLSRMLTILSIIVGFSRVYVGHHYPMDVIGAYIIVWITGCIYNFKLRDKVDNLYGFIENKLVQKLKLQRLFTKA
jgi:undecaprenyl-diphosphatase